MTMTVLRLALVTGRGALVDGVWRSTPPQSSLGRVPVGLLLLASQANDGWRRQLAVFIHAVPLGQSKNHAPLGKRLKRVPEL